MDLEWGHINEYYEECSLIIGSTKKDECHVAGAGPKTGLKKKKNFYAFNERIFDLTSFKNIKEESKTSFLMESIYGNTSQTFFLSVRLTVIPQ